MAHSIRDMPRMLSNVLLGTMLAKEAGIRDLIFPRSEEHTSELQSQSNLVCRLLLEKKNLADKAIIALLSLAATLPMMAGRIPLTVGFGIVIRHILAICLISNAGVPSPPAEHIVLVR